ATTATAPTVATATDRRISNRGTRSATATWTPMTTRRPAPVRWSVLNPASAGATATIPTTTTVASAAPHPAEPTQTGPVTATTSATVPTGPTVTPRTAHIRAIRARAHPAASGASVSGTADPTPTRLPTVSSTTTRSSGSAGAL